jgi:hypothetical protein
MLWEAIFLLLVLKIPLVYLCLVVWWAIRAEPRDEHPASVAPVGSRPRVPHGPSRKDRSRTQRDRVGPRPAVARGETRR